MLSYSECYLALGATPDTDWETLRANYKRLIGRWHPDRFSGDAVSKRIAEERSKQITLAYQTLEKYRRDHGELPPTKPAAAAQGPRSAEPVSERAGSEVRVDAVNAGPAVHEVAKRRPGRLTRIAIASVFFALIAALYLVQHYQDEGAPREDRTAGNAHDPGVATPAPRLREGPRDSPGISTGSTLGDVYAIQGVPTLTQGDTWHYGKSQIRFAQGKVISWKEHPDDPLRVVHPSAHSHGTTFDVGSTKEEVRAVQGTPVRETDTVWDYAPSRVYFRHNRVIRWEESPVQPLRVPR